MDSPVQPDDVAVDQLGLVDENAPLPRPHLDRVPALGLEVDEGQRGAELGALHHVLEEEVAQRVGVVEELVERRARAIADGAATIAADGRADCFEA